MLWKSSHRLHGDRNNSCRLHTPDSSHTDEYAELREFSPGKVLSITEERLSKNLQSLHLAFRCSSLSCCPY
jgi:hypothetical protein